MSLSPGDPETGAGVSERPPLGAVAPARGSVTIELSQAQVDQVLHRASVASSISLLMLSGLSDLRDALALAPEYLEDTRMSRSLLVGLLLLSAMPADGSRMSLTEVARTLGLTISTAHRYVYTLVTIGLLERDPSTRKYRLAYVA